MKISRGTGRSGSGLGQVSGVSSKCSEIAATPSWTTWPLLNTDGGSDYLFMRGVLAVANHFLFPPCGWTRRDVSCCVFCVVVLCSRTRGVTQLSDCTDRRTRCIDHPCKRYQYVDNHIRDKAPLRHPIVNSTNFLSREQPLSSRPTIRVTVYVARVAHRKGPQNR